MKTFGRVLGLGLLTFVLTAAMSIAVLGQDSIAEKTALYEKYTANYAGSIAQKRIAVAAGKEYIAKYGSNPDDKEIVDYLKSAIPAIEKAIEDELKAEAARKEAAEKQARYNRFDKSMTSKNWAATYKVGGEILAKEPNMLDVILVLGSIGLDEIGKNPPVDTFNDSTIKYARTAINKINSGVSSKKYGAYAYEYKSKDNALAWMNYTIGMIMNLRQGTDPMKKKQSLKYLFAATKFNSDRKKEPLIYDRIGDWYYSKASGLVASRKVLLAKEKELIAQRNAAPKEEQEALDKEIDSIQSQIDTALKVEYGYVDRAIDAFARAHQLVRTNTKAVTFKNRLMQDIKDLYNFRYQKPEQKSDMVINAYLAGVMATPMPDPMSEVRPADDAAKTAAVGTSRSRTVPTGAKTGNR